MRENGRLYKRGKIVVRLWFSTRQHGSKWLVPQNGGISAGLFVDSCDRSIHFQIVNSPRSSTTNSLDVVQALKSMAEQLQDESRCRVAMVIYIVMLAMFLSSFVLLFSKS